MFLKSIKNAKVVVTTWVLSSSKYAPKSVFGRGSAPDPSCLGAYSAPPDTLAGAWEGG